MTPQQIQQMIDQSLKKSFTQKRIGDTPTDALQLVNKKYVDANAGGYAGYVNSAGTKGTPFPTGWSVVAAGTIYTITHNLGTLNYAATFVCVVPSGSGALPIVTSRTANTIVLVWINLASNLQNNDFMFLVNV